MLKEKILAIATHPDDEILGMGGTLKKHINNNNEVYVCIVTSTWKPKWGEKDNKRRKEESCKVGEFLGVKNLFRLDYPTIKLDTVPINELIYSIEKIVSEVRPHTVYTNYKNDLNADHGVVFQAVSVATRPISGIKKLLAAETPSETDLALPLLGNAFQPNFYIDISNELEDKIKAAKMYKSEMKTFPHLRSEEVIRAMAIKRGAEVNLKAAEAFVLLRYII